MVSISSLISVSASVYLWSWRRRRSHSPDVEVLVLGDLGELAAVLLLEVLEVVVVLRLELVGPGGTEEGGGDADEEAGG
jgi:hypothetical protein